MKTQEEVINSFLDRRIPERPIIKSELENIWELGYHCGYETAEKLAKAGYEEDSSIQYNRGYQYGYTNGKDTAYKELSGWTIEEGKKRLKESYQEGYDKGADDGRQELWWAVKKLFCYISNGGLSVEAIGEIFGTLYMEEILTDCTPEEVIEKIKAYEESKKSAPSKREKLKEVFGYDPADLPIWPLSWWDEPYEEPEHDHS